MKRSGSTVQYQLTAELVEFTGAGRALGWITTDQFPKLQATFGSEKQLLVVKCHSYIQGAADLISRGEAKAIYVYRDIRDALVSTLNKHKRSFWEVARGGFIESVLKEYYEWNTGGGILLSKYETMVTELRNEVLRIAEYLGVGVEDSFASQVAEKYSIEKQMQRIKSFDYENLGIGVGRDIYDPISLLHSNHIQSGRCEQWRKVLSAFQLGLIEDIGYNWLLERGYPISQSWVNRNAVGTAYWFYRMLRVLRLTS